jgi:hypothetical protein
VQKRPITGDGGRHPESAVSPKRTHESTIM